MIVLDIPGWGRLELAHAVFDWNGTLALDGRLPEALLPRLEALQKILTCHVCTAATHGDVTEEVKRCDMDLTLVRDGLEKARFVESLKGGVVAIGNGHNDVPMLRSAELAIAVVGPEGMYGELLSEADIVVGRIEDAIDLLLHPRRLLATLRS